MGVETAIPCLARSYWEIKDQKAKDLIRKFLNEDLPNDVLETILEEME